MNIPYHVAVIMDGNGRWAKARGLPRTFGHKKGVDRVREIMKEAKKLGIKMMTVFAFSTENWNRPKREINMLFSFLVKFLDSYDKELMDDDVKLNAIGRRDRIDAKVIKRLEQSEKLTQNNKSFVFNLALDYGGRWDINNAVKKIIVDHDKGKVSKKDITDDFFRQYLCLGDLPDPDLLIRTSGEERISNFLLWNLAYSELYFTKVHWPGFTKKELAKALEAYATRNRRYGKVK